MHIEQGSPEWLELRRTKIGASDAATCLGLNPYKTRKQLWEEKVLGKEVFISEAMRRGTELEPHARRAYEEKTGKAMFPVVRFHVEHNWMMASMDGVSLDEKEAIEIKCPGEKNHLLALKGQIPMHYKCQLMHQMMVLNIREIDFFSYHPDFESILITVQFDEKLADEILEAEKDFYNLMLSKTPPSQKQEDNNFNEDESVLLTRLKNSSLLYNEAKKEYEFLKQEVLDHFQKPLTYNDLVIEKISQKGRIDYNSIPELSQVDLDQYRSPNQDVWRVRLQR